MTAHMRINWAGAIKSHLDMSHQPYLIVNIFVVVSKRALVVIHDLSDGHLRPKEVSILNMRSKNETMFIYVELGP